ncbi:MAG: bifunctional diaminohydroxyphosphoribosylaminopyrimidine deaminase/5-amino-6-(5-phosphoribosylamino)uracil reductase RibD [Oligosphaeraceae bacterium]|nr:bifunctional diaminohydroxyphosphoribosylaminopyrimidine deaminase/5-amino-6-(5-phosphoribosylamino)uracil reductase RibD [Oligosphaeraceae bacterium]
MSSKYSKQDEYLMRQALQEAERGWGLCSPNPMVGAIIFKDGEELARGYHERCGGAHAEIMALQRVGELARGAELYVTLEPCSSTGRTAPCVQAIIEAGIKRVNIGCLDSNPMHAGRGVKILQQAGIETRAGLLEEDCRRLNEHFFWWIREKRPFVYLKMAMSLDGKIALPDGSSKWITGPFARSQVQKLRRLAGAIMVGGQTLRCDDPSLLVNEPADWPMQPQVCIWSSKKPEPGDSYKIMQGGRSPALFIKPVGTEQWLEFLRQLGAKDCNFLLLEGGGELAEAALSAGIVNKIGFFVAPKLILGRDAIPVVGGRSVKHLDQAIQVLELKCENFGQDILLSGYCQNVYRNN